MVDATAKKLLTLLQAGRPLELRCAALLVLGEVAPRDALVGKAVCQALDDPEPAIRIQATAAAGKLQVTQALPVLLQRVTAGGPESEAAAQAAARLGPKGTQALQTLMHEVAPGLRRRIAGALGGAGTAGAETAALETLLDSDPGVVDAAVRSLTQEIPTLIPEHRERMAEQALDLLKPRKGAALAALSEVALIRLLGALAEPRAEAAFWSRLEPNQSVELRAAALQGLGTLGVKPAREKLKRLLECATASDFRVAAPALMLLRPLEIPEKSVGDWLGLFAAPDPAVRRFAIEKLAHRDLPEVAQVLLDQMRHPDSGLRNEALQRLTQLEHGRAALAQALQEAATPDEAWALARAQLPIAREHPPAVQTQLFKRACAYLEAGDRRADPVLAVLREADARGLRDKIEERALALRKKKDYEAALTYLRLLTRDPSCAESVRFEVAACGLKLSSHDLAAEARAADHGLQQFARLIHHSETPPIERVEAAKWLDPEDLFYLGFHFVEGERREKEFGAAMLELVLKRSARSKLAKDAKSKLRSAGLG